MCEERAIETYYIRYMNIYIYRIFVSHHHQAPETRLLAQEKGRLSHIECELSTCISMSREAKIYICMEEEKGNEETLDARSSISSARWARSWMWLYALSAALNTSYFSCENFFFENLSNDYTDSIYIYIVLYSIWNIFVSWKLGGKHWLELNA